MLLALIFSFAAITNLVSAARYGKRTSHSKLALIKAMIEAGRVRMTASAIAGAELLGFERSGMISVVLALKPEDLYKPRLTIKS